MEKQKISYSAMCRQLSEMPKEEIEQHLQELGCTWSYEKITATLGQTWNDLSVGDQIFQECTINAEQSCYETAFLDEAVLEICRREAFGFRHYGIILSAVEELMDSEQMEVESWLQAMEKEVLSLIKLARRFHITSLEALLYQANDGSDLIGALAAYLDQLLQQGKKDRSYCDILIRLCEKLQETFPHMGEDLFAMFSYEQASAYIAKHSSKGERIFQELLKTSADKTDVVLHYGLAYLDEDEKRCLRIFKRYEAVLDKDSDAYEAIREIQRDRREKIR